MAINSVTTTDPTAGNDGTQGFTAGSTWKNLTNGNIWVCTDPTTSVAVWSLVASAGPVALATPSGNPTGTITTPLRTRGAVEPDLLEAIRDELTVIRLLLATAFNNNVTPEDLR